MASARRASFSNTTSSAFGSPADLLPRSLRSWYSKLRGGLNIKEFAIKYKDAHKDDHRNSSTLRQDQEVRRQFVLYVTGQKKGTFHHAQLKGLTAEELQSILIPSKTSLQQPEAKNPDESHASLSLLASVAHHSYPVSNNDGETDNSRRLEEAFMESLKERMKKKQNPGEDETAASAATVLSNMKHSSSPIAKSTDAQGGRTLINPTIDDILNIPVKRKASTWIEEMEQSFQRNDTTLMMNSMDEESQPPKRSQLVKGITEQEIPAAKTYESATGRVRANLQPTRRSNRISNDTLALQTPSSGLKPSPEANPLGTGSTDAVFGKDRSETLDSSPYSTQVTNIHSSTNNTQIFGQNYSAATSDQPQNSITKRRKADKLTSENDFQMTMNADDSHTPASSSRAKQTLPASSQSRKSRQLQSDRVQGKACPRCEQKHSKCKGNKCYDQLKKDAEICPPCKKSGQQCEPWHWDYYQQKLVLPLNAP